MKDILGTRHIYVANSKRFWLKIISNPSINFTLGPHSNSENNKTKKYYFNTLLKYFIYNFLFLVYYFSSVPISIDFIDIVSLNDFKK